MSEETLVVSKPAWASKGIIGSVVVILVSALSLVSFFIPSLRDIQINTDGLVEAITGAITLIFGALALWGRIKANAPVHFINKKTVPGGAFNPDAPVRKAEPVTNAERSTRNTQHRRGGNPKNGSTLTRLLFCIGLGLLALFVLLPFVGCASVDGTPDRRETAAVINATAKVVWTPVVFGAGVVTWIPVVVVSHTDESFDRAACYLWPFYLTGMWWEADL